MKWTKPAAKKSLKRTVLDELNAAACRLVALAVEDARREDVAANLVWCQGCVAQRDRRVPCPRCSQCF